MPNVQYLRLSLAVGHAELRAIKINLGASLLQTSKLLAPARVVDDVLTQLKECYFRNIG